MVVVLTALLIGLAAAGPAAAKDVFSYSPLTAFAAGPSGPASALFAVGPHCCPSTAIIARSAGAIGENDFQFIELGLTTPAARTLKRVRVCYETDAPGAGATYISQTQLTEMIRLDSATVRVDDPTDQTAFGPACYTVDADFEVRGTLTLGLKIVIADPADTIRIGMVKLIID